MNTFYYCVSCWDLGTREQRKVWTKFDTWQTHNDFLTFLNDWNQEGAKANSGLIYTYWEISQAEWENQS